MSDEPVGTADAPSPTLGQWDELTQALARLGKQQLRANQLLEMLTADRDATRGAYESQIALITKQHDDQRRTMQELNDDARETRLAFLACIDQLDDLMAVARQRDDKAWTDRVEKLSQRMLRVFQDIGVTEVGAVTGDAFDERVHEAADTVDAGDRPQFVITEVLQRGFMYRGKILRRAQVVATR